MRAFNTLDDFFKKIDFTHTCWLWRGGLNHGYGYFPWQREHTVAHRFSYELFVGEIPEGMELDHLCNVRNCVNPAHLEPVTRQENCIRAAPELCIRGHKLVHGQVCKKCDAIRSKRWRERSEMLL